MSEFENQKSPLLPSSFKTEDPFSFFRAILHIPSIISGKSTQTVVNPNLDIIMKEHFLGFVPYGGILLALTLLWAMVLVSFYNVYVYFDLSFSGDFGTYTCIAIYKLTTYLLGTSARHSRVLNEQRLFIGAMVVSLIIDSGLIFYDISAISFNPYLLILVFIADAYLLYVATFYIENLRLKPESSGEDRENSQNFVQEDRHVKLRRSLVIKFEGYGTVIIASLVIWTLCHFMGITVSSLIQTASSQSFYFMVACGHIVLAGFGVYGFFRKEERYTYIFIVGLWALVFFDLINVVKEINNAYNYNYIPFNYPLFFGLDVYLLVKSITFRRMIMEFKSEAYKIRDQSDIVNVY